MQINPSFPSDPPSPNSTAIYDEAERGDAPGDAFLEGARSANPHSQFGNPTYYGPVPVYDNPFFEQMGGGQTTEEPQTPSGVRWNFRRHVPLTPLGSNTAESCNFALRHAQTAASLSESSGSLNTQAMVNELLDGLDEELIASMAYDRSSSFSSLEDEHTQADNTPCKKKSLPIKDTSSPPVEDNPAPAVKSNSSQFLDDFFRTGEFQPIVLPPGPAPSKALDLAVSPTQPNDKTPDSFIKKPVRSVSPSEEHSLSPPTHTPPAMHSAPSKEHSITPPTHSPPSKPQASTDGRPSRVTLQQCEESFLRIEKIFIELARLVQRPVSQVKKWFIAGIKIPRTTSNWNLYQAYFADHCEEELQRCGLENGTGMKYTAFLSAFMTDDWYRL